MLNVGSPKIQLKFSEMLSCTKLFKLNLRIVTDVRYNYLTTWPHVCVYNMQIKIIRWSYFVTNSKQTRYKLRETYYVLVL